jgi:hypothetical protein
VALRAEGRADDASRLLGCFRDRLAVELNSKARLPQEWPGDLEFRRASFAALTGNREDVVAWLRSAVGRGWLGQPYSSRLADYPQFDALRADRRLGDLQQRIDDKIARERAELAAQGRPAQAV